MPCTVLRALNGTCYLHKICFNVINEPCESLYPTRATGLYNRDLTEHLGHSIAQSPSPSKITTTPAIQAPSSRSYRKPPGSEPHYYHSSHCLLISTRVLSTSLKYSPPSRTHTRTEVCMPPWVRKVQEFLLIETASYRPDIVRRGRSIS
jgi:hypothetical protein